MMKEGLKLFAGKVSRSFSLIVYRLLL